MSKITWGLLVCVVMVSSVFCLPAFAVDGQVLINQSTVIAAGGFPYVISEPGSYKLSGNLSVPVGVNGIAISASNVSLDLNGFSIICLGPFTAAGKVSAIYAVGSVSSISIHNGMIVGPTNNPFGFIGVNFSSNSLINVQDLFVRSDSASSIQVGPNSLVRHTIVTGLIEVACPSIILENTSTGFITQIESSGNTCVRWHNRSLADTAAVTQ